MTKNAKNANRKAKAYVAPEMESAVIDSKVYAQSEELLERQEVSDKSPEELVNEKIEQAVTAAKKATVKKVGVIETIANLIILSGETGISKKAILAELIAKFPERLPVHMAATVSVQVPSRINKERFPLKKLEGGLYACAEVEENEEVEE